LDWITRNPHLTTAAITGAAAVVLFVVRIGLSRHREYVAFVSHMRREEAEVWPQTVNSLHALDEKVTEFHVEMLRQFSVHGERLAKVEARMPNGELAALKGLVEQLLERR
jgi:hypothetical protein